MLRRLLCLLRHKWSAPGTGAEELVCQRCGSTRNLAGRPLADEFVNTQSRGTVWELRRGRVSLRGRGGCAAAVF